MKLIIENWRKYVNENREKLRRLYDLTDDYPNIEYERLEEIAWQVEAMMQKGASIEAFALEFEGDEAEYAKRLFALKNELERKKRG